MAIQNPEAKLFGLQYHPEVVHSKNGIETLKQFLFGVAAIPADWKMANVLDEEMAKISALVRALCTLALYDTQTRGNTSGCTLKDTILFASPYLCSLSSRIGRGRHQVPAPTMWGVLPAPREQNTILPNELSALEIAGQDEPGNDVSISKSSAVSNGTSHPVSSSSWITTNHGHHLI